MATQVETHSRCLSSARPSLTGQRPTGYQAALRSACGRWPIGTFGHAYVRALEINSMVSVDGLRRPDQVRDLRACREPCCGVSGDGSDV